MRTLLLLLAALPAIAQGTLSLSCPTPARFNQSAVCPITFAGSAVAIQWNLTTTPKVTVAVATPLTSKSLGSGPGGLYVLSGMNQTNLSGVIANITIPAHSGAVTLNLSNILASSAAAHFVTVLPSVTVTVQ